jgi:Tfp pilus assembly protein PilW
MVLTSVQLIIAIAIGLLVVSGVVFVIADSRAYKREQEAASSALRSRRLQREHETA